MRQATGVLAALAVLVLVAGAAGLAGYTVDKTRTEDLRDMLREADRLATQPPSDDFVSYFRMHGGLAAAAGVDSCSPFAIRMTQRFLPEGWRFNSDDVAAIQAGRRVTALRLEAGEFGTPTWNC